MDEGVTDGVLIDLHGVDLADLANCSLIPGEETALDDLLAHSAPEGGFQNCIGGESY